MRGQSDAACTPTGPLGALFRRVEGWSRQYSEPGLATAIMLEFPERVKRLGLSSEIVHRCLPKAQRLVEPFVRTFLDGLDSRDSAAFTADTVRAIDRLLSFDMKWIADEMFETLTGLARTSRAPSERRKPMGTPRCDVDAGTRPHLVGVVAQG